MSDQSGTRAEAGSVLMLVPAAVLVLIILAAIAVDLSIVFLGQRELSNVAAAAANDAATAAISKEAFYRGHVTGSTGEIEIDDAQAREVLARVLSLQSPRGVTVTGYDLRAPGPRVCITVEGRVDYLFAKAIPGVAHAKTVRGRASVTAVQGQAGSSVPFDSVC